MTEEDKNIAFDIIGNVSKNNIEMFTDFSLIYKATEILSKNLINPDYDIGWINIDFIPTIDEIEESRNILVKKGIVNANSSFARILNTSTFNTIIKSYIINSTALIDGMIEDLYAHFLKVYNRGLSDDVIAKKVRDAWIKNNVFNFFTKTVKLCKPNNQQIDFDELILRYSECRILRHTLVHTNGKISDRNYQKLIEIEQNTPSDKKSIAFLYSKLINENRQIVFPYPYSNFLEIYTISKFYINYFTDSLREKSI